MRTQENALESVPIVSTDTRSDLLVDKAAEELYPTWSKNVEEWKKTGGDHAYHYLGSAIWFNRIGKAMGEAMLELLPDSK